MTLSLTGVSSHRFLPEALRRLAPQTQLLKNIISEMILESPPTPILMLTLVDRPYGYCKEIENNDNIRQFEVGFDPALALQPIDAERDDPVFFTNIIRGIELAINSLTFSGSDKAAVEAALAKCNTLMKKSNKKDEA